MTFGRQKRLLIGWLAFLAPVPLPFNDVVEWWVLVAYLGGVLLFLRRARRDPPRWLPVWGLNVLGIAYLPVFLADLFVFDRGHLTHPVLHLCLFSLLVKLFALTRERDKWQAAMGVFFLFLASMGTSVHPAIALFLVAFLALTLALLVRFAFLHVLAGFGREDESLAHLPIGGFLAFAALAVVVLAVPLFALLPRVRTPYIVGRGTGTGTTIEAAGFSDAVTLDSIGRIRGSREVALRLQDERGGGGAPELLRFKAAAQDLYDGGSWRRAPLVGELPRSQGVQFWLARRSRGSPPAAARAAGPAVAHWMKIWLQPLHSRSLPLPVETAVVEPRVANLMIDEGGAVALGFMPLEVVEYRVGLARQPVLTGVTPNLGPATGSAAGSRAGSGGEAADGAGGEPTLDRTGVSPRMAELAARVMGTGPAEVRAKRLETYLMQSYDYTQDFRDRSTENPIEDFLFRYKSGHCEYFASAMVLLLRSQGIPARLVTGFLGGEYNPFEGYTIVRNSNAHAWVEAYVADGPAGLGWQTFDPTPPAGRPAGAESGAWPLAHQAYDYLLFRWDRYVLTYGLYDQLRIVSDLHDLWERLRRAFDRHPAPRRAAAASGTVAGTVVGAPAPHADRRPKAIVLALLFALLALVAWRLVRAYRAPLTATRAYRRLRRRASGAGLAVADSVAPLAFRRAAAIRYPQAAEPAARVIELYLRESFGERPLAEDELDQLRDALSQAERGLRKAG